MLVATGGGKKKGGVAGKTPKGGIDLISDADPKPKPKPKPTPKPVPKPDNGKNDKTKNNNSSNKKGEKKEPDVCVIEKIPEPKQIATYYKYSKSFPVFNYDYGVFTLKFSKVIEAKYVLSKGDIDALKNVGMTIGNNLNIDTSIDFGDISTVLKNLGFSFSFGSWGQLNFSFYTSYKKTSTTLRYYCQTINIFANDGVNYNSMTKIDDYVRMGLSFEISLNKFLAAALIVGATVAVPAMASILSSQAITAAAWLKAYGSASATLAFI